jgi:hypothetical protein
MDSIDNIQDDDWDQDYEDWLAYQDWVQQMDWD